MTKLLFGVIENIYYEEVRNERDQNIFYRKDRKQRSVAIKIAASEQGHGYGAEALAAITNFCFEHTELQRLWTEVDVRNIPSQKMLEKCGYIREGHIRQGKMVNTWCDYYIYGILAFDVCKNDKNNSNE